MTEAEMEKLLEYAAYRGVIERTEVDRTQSVALNDAGEQIYVIGRGHATAIVRALDAAGYQIVRKQPLR